MKRRPKRRPDGRWQRRAKGKLFTSSISQEDADRKAREYAKAIEDGLRRDADTITFREYATAWLPRAKAGLSQNYYNDEATRLRRFCKFVGYTKLKDVRPSDIQAFYNDFLSGKSKSLARKTANLLSSVFTSAIDDGYCTKNPVKAGSVHFPKNLVDDGTHRELEEWERDLIENHTKEEKLYPIIMLMLYTGMRPSEAMAINVQRDVDFEKKRIIIHESRHLIGRKAYTSEEGKTELAVGRVLPLFSPLEEVLRGRIGRIIANDKGEVLSKGEWDSMWESYIVHVEQKLNGHRKIEHHRKLDDPVRIESLARLHAGDKQGAYDVRMRDWKEFTVRPYDLRHEFCTWCCYHEIDMHTVINWMGHKNYEMIQKIYDHVNARRFEKQVEKLEKALDSSQKSMQSDIEAVESAVK